MRAVSVVLAAALAFVAADVAYPNNPECGWGNEIYRAVGDWAQDAGSSQNWDPAESKGVMTATHNKPCEYQAVVRGLRPGKQYSWKVTIAGEKSGWSVNWGCNGNNNAPACTFSADPSGGVTFTVIASYAYPLTTSNAPGSGGSTTGSSTTGSSSTSGSSSGSSTGSSGTLLVGKDLNGNDFKQISVSNYQACQSACNGESSCKAWSFDTCPGGTTCWLKNAAASPSDNNCRTSGIKSGSGSSTSGSSTSGSSTSGSSSSSTGGGSTSGGGTSTSNKKVFAHYMMGFAYGSDKNFFMNTIGVAQSVGIDGFAVNVGTDGQQMNIMQNFLDAAASKNFKLFISLDCNEIQDMGVMANWVNKFVDHPAYFRYNNRPFVSTFAGQDHGNGAWNDWKKNQVGSKNIYFCPNFFGDLGSMYNNFPVIDCLFSWDAWEKDVSNSRDVPAIQAGHSVGKQYMAGVAPWFFCHLPQWSKNWFWPQGPDNGAENIWTIRWRQAIASGADFVEIITWNDYSESSYIAPLSQEVPTFCSSYVDGMDHSAFLKMTAYYSAYFKNGSPPQMKQNSVYWWYRIHGKNQNRNDGAGKPQMFWSNPGDCVSVHTISGSTGGAVTVSIGGRQSTFTISSQEQDTCVPFGGTGAVRVSVQRNGQTYTGSNGPDIQGDGNGYNFNVWTGAIDYPV